MEIAEDCIEQCNGMRHLPPGDREARCSFLAAAQRAGLVVECVGSRQGLIHPICQQPEATKQFMTAAARAELSTQTENTPV